MCILLVIFSYFFFICATFVFFFCLFLNRCFFSIIQKSNNIISQNKKSNRLFAKWTGKKMSNTHIHTYIEWMKLLRFLFGLQFIIKHSRTHKTHQFINERFSQSKSKGFFFTKKKNTNSIFLIMSHCGEVKEYIYIFFLFRYTFFLFIYSFFLSFYLLFLFSVALLNFSLLQKLKCHLCFLPKSFIFYCNYLICSVLSVVFFWFLLLFILTLVICFHSSWILSVDPSSLDSQCKITHIYRQIKLFA